jgi:hypothetical protein
MLTCTGRILSVNVGMARGFEYHSHPPGDEVERLLVIPSVSESWKRWAKDLLLRRQGFRPITVNRK